MTSLIETLRPDLSVARGFVAAALMARAAPDVLHDAAPYRSLAHPFAARDIDVLFIASNWRRPEKNAALLRRIGATCGDLRVHVVGANAPADLAAQHHGIVGGRAAIYGLLGRAKVLVCPSRWDPAPGGCSRPR